MDWDLAIEINRAALKRIVAMLVAMAGMGQPSLPCRALAPQGDRSAGITLPRHLHRAVLRLLRPAESAARRLVIAAAREMLAVPVRPMPGAEVGGGLGMLVDGNLPPPLTPPLKGEGGTRAASCSEAQAPSENDAEFPSPLRGSEGRARPVARPGRVRGGGNPAGAHRPGSAISGGEPAVVHHTGQAGTDGRKPAPTSRSGANGNAAIRKYSLPLIDTLPPWNPRRSVRNSFPRISVPGYTQPAPIPPSPAQDDPLDATRLVLRLQALERALDDLPGHARRFARWRHRAVARARYQDAVAARARGNVSRTITHVMKPAARTVRCWPLRMGRPPGSRRRGRHEVHEVLMRTTGLALYALAGRDTS